MILHRLLSRVLCTKLWNERVKGRSCLLMSARPPVLMFHPQNYGTESEWEPTLMSRDSSVGIATGWIIGWSEFDSRQELGIFLLTTASRPALGLTQPPIQRVPGVLALEVKRPAREADHSPPSSDEVKECVELYLNYPDTSYWYGV
jgi:hypothetical protein